MCGGGGGGGDGGAAERERQRQKRISQGLNQINTIFGGFDDDFYNSRADAYTDYATPQLDDQYQKAVEQLTYALARNNRLDSSVAAEQRADLLKDYNLQKVALADRAQDYSNRARSNVEASRSDLVSLNSNLANPSQVAAEANARLAGLQAADSFEPLAPLFVNVGEGLGTQADVERRGTAKYNTGLFTPAAVSGGESSQTIKK